jgi:hypothetical protein
VGLGGCWQGFSAGFPGSHCLQWMHCLGVAVCGECCIVGGHSASPVAGGVFLVGCATAARWAWVWVAVCAATLTAGGKQGVPAVSYGWAFDSRVCPHGCACLRSMHLPHTPCMQDACGLKWCGVEAAVLGCV